MSWILLLSIVAASAHDVTECPPLSYLQSAARDGRLDHAGRHCLEEARVDAQLEPLRRWALWADRLLREGPGDALDDELRELLDTTTDPDQVVEAAELLVARDPQRAAPVVSRGWELSGGWLTPVTRARGAGRLGALEASLDPVGGPVRWAQGLRDLGVSGSELTRATEACEAIADGPTCATPVRFPALVQPGPPGPDELVACMDVGHLWVRALWGGVYTSERDCVARAVDGMSQEPGRAVAARLAVVLALHNSRDDGLTVVARHVAPLLSGVDEVAAQAAEAHREAGDEAGARWWTRRSGTPGDLPGPETR